MQYSVGNWNFHNSLAALSTTLLLSSYTPVASQPAHQIFEGFDAPSAGQNTESIGHHAKGCIAGAVQLSEAGYGWYAVRRKRNRHWGHPDMMSFIERLGEESIQSGSNGVLISDISMPRGGPFRTAHRSHQIGLDADIWLRQAPGRSLNRKQVSELHAPSFVSGGTVNNFWRDQQYSVLRAAAKDTAVAIIFVNHAVREKMCASAHEKNDLGGWTKKIRGWRGHDRHFHVRLKCPVASLACINPPARLMTCAVSSRGADTAATTTRGSASERNATALGFFGADQSETVMDKLGNTGSTFGVDRGAMPYANLSPACKDVASNRASIREEAWTASYSEYGTFFSWRSPVVLSGDNAIRGSEVKLVGGPPWLSVRITRNGRVHLQGSAEGSEPLSFNVVITTRDRNQISKLMTINR